MITVETPIIMGAFLDLVIGSSCGDVVVCTYCGGIDKQSTVATHLVPALVVILSHIQYKFNLTPFSFSALQFSHFTIGY
jgi:hypothetical protein